FGQYTRGLLEGGRGDERLGGQRGLGDTQQHAVVLRFLLAFLAQTRILGEHAYVLDLLALDELRIAHLDNLGLAQHLADNHLDVIVVDAHALQTVNVLYFVDDVLGQRLDAFQAQDIVRARRAVGTDLATLDVLALEHRHLAPLRNQHFVVRAAVERIHAICRRDDQAALALGFLAEADG